MLQPVSNSVSAIKMVTSYFTLCVVLAVIPFEGRAVGRTGIYNIEKYIGLILELW